MPVQGAIADCLYRKSLNVGLNSILFEVEAEILLNALLETNFNRAKAARYLKINRTTLVEKVRRLKACGYRIPDRSDSMIFPSSEPGDE